MDVIGPFEHVARRLLLGLLAVTAAASVWLGASMPAKAQMMGVTMAQIAGPFAGRMGPGAPGMTAPYGSQAGAFAHLMQGTQMIMPSMPRTIAGLSGMSMASSTQTAAAPGPMLGPGMESMGTMAPHPRIRTGDAGEAGDVEKPEAGEIGDSFWEIMIGACTGGAFIGAYAIANAPAPVAAAGVAAPAAATAIVSAMAVGCGLGVATAGVSLGAVMGWRRLRR